MMKLKPIYVPHALETSDSSLRLGIEDDDRLDELVRYEAIPLDYYCYRFGFRDIAASTNERSMICCRFCRQQFLPETP